MVFSSIFFIFVLLPISLLLVAVANVITKLVHKESSFVLWRNIILVCISFVFYAWGENWLVAPLFGLAYINFILGKKIEQKLSVPNNQSSAKTWLICSVAFNLLLLIACKYSVWIANSFLLLYSTLLGTENVIVLKGFALPLGISFFTFQAISYLIDVYRKEIAAAKTYVEFSCYLTMFSQLIAGPIVRYIDIANDIKQNNMSLDNMYTGIQRFILGLGKKVIIANQMALIADTMFGAPVLELTSAAAWVGILAYALQIYYDFSGYSDMAIGLGLMFGFKFMENFKHPYGALSIQDFWHKWHISLSTWFRDYVYIPLGGNRVSNFRTYFNLLLIFLLCGLWHGANLTFLLWGAWHGLFLMLERAGVSGVLTKLPNILRRAYVWSVFLFGWVLFRADNMTHAQGFFKALFGMNNSTPTLDIGDILTNQYFCVIFIVGIFASMGWPAKQFLRIRELSYNSVVKASCFEWSVFIFGSLCLLLSITHLLSSTYNPFIYFRF